MLSPIIKNKIELKYGSKIRYPKDCDGLASAISKECNCQISGSTIKRLFGLIKGAGSARLFTLDVISNYLGCESWDEMLTELVEDKPVSDSKIKNLQSKDVRKGTCFCITFGKTANIEVKYLGKNTYSIIKQNKTLLLPNDEVVVDRFHVHFPVLVSKIRRGTEVKEGTLLGGITGVTEIVEIK